ncbi:MAG TPA: universal stress protein [Gaiellaceae bacterium]|jgi:nucleotide-binding universal stress UspA family protein|nr:universal stress protein [Gaiellaceae bacterium]
MNTILVATDGSEQSRAAVATAVGLAEDEDARLVCVHVVSVVDFAPRENGYGTTPPARVPRAEDDPVLAEALAVGEDCGVRTEGQLLVGYPPKQILRLANDLDADLIVVGSRGLRSVKSVVFGSTSREIMAHADRPVLVVRQMKAGAPALA